MYSRHGHPPRILFSRGTTPLTAPHPSATPLQGQGTLGGGGDRRERERERESVREHEDILIGSCSAENSTHELCKSDF